MPNLFFPYLSLYYGQIRGMAWRHASCVRHAHAPTCLSAKHPTSSSLAVEFVGTVEIYIWWRERGRRREAWRGGIFTSICWYRMEQSAIPLYIYIYSTSPRNRNPVNRNHLDQSLSFSQKNRNSLTWVLVALTVCFTYPVLYRVSSESRAGEWEL